MGINDAYVLSYYRNTMKGKIMADENGTIVEETRQEGDGQQGTQEQADPTAELMEELKGLREEYKKLQDEFKGFKDSFSTQIRKGVVVQDDNLPEPPKEDFKLTAYEDLDFTIK